MAIVKIRDLVRQPKRVFAELEATGEPVLVTRNGEAIAALFPVDPQEAAQLAMAALPEFVESRRRAEHARSEGRTRSRRCRQNLAARQEQAQAHRATEPASEAEQVVMESPSEPSGFVIEALREVFGSYLGRELAPQVDVLIADASEPVVLAAAAAALPTSDNEDLEEANREVELRIHQLTGQLFRRLFPVVLECKVLDRLAFRPASGTEMYGSEVESDGMLGKQLAEGNA